MIPTPDPPNVIRLHWGPDGRPLRTDAARMHAALHYFDQADAIDHDESRLGEAEELYRKAVVLAPRIAGAWTNLGSVIFRRTGNGAAAMCCYRRALDAHPSCERTLYNMGYIRAEQGEYETAIELFKRSLEIDPAFEDARTNLEMAERALAWSLAAYPSARRTRRRRASVERG